MSEIEVHGELICHRYAGVSQHAVNVSRVRVFVKAFDGHNWFLSLQFLSPLFQPFPILAAKRQEWHGEQAANPFRGIWTDTGHDVFVAFATDHGLLSIRAPTLRHLPQDRRNGGGWG